MTQTVLIVEDEPKLAELLADYLRQAQYRIHIIDNGLEVVDWVKAERPDLVLLDVMLPGMDGLEICRELRTFSNVPVIMVTAKVEEIDRLIGLELGADDYVCKPFSPRELVIRVRNLLRRMGAGTQENSGDAPGRLRLNQDAISVQLGEQALSLTKIEFELLRVLSAHPGKIFSRDMLIDRIYSDHRIVSGRTIDSHIKKLRVKLERLNELAGVEKDWIVSIYGVGYKAER